MYYKEAAEYIRSRLTAVPEIGVILGTGLGEAADIAADAEVIPYSCVPNMPASTVRGHKGRFLTGRLGGKNIIIMQGRVHFYEGYSMAQLAVPIQIMKALGVKALIVTNASGGINESYSPGDIVIIDDHIKLDLDSPLRGENPEELGERFFDMTKAYSPRLKAIARAVLEELGVSAKTGVYAYMGGPQFETPAEIRALRLLGADLVGMSTVPEVIAAVHCGMEVLGLSCVTNMAAGMEDGGLNREVIGRAEAEAKERLKKLIAKVVEAI